MKGFEKKRPKVKFGKQSSEELAEGFGGGNAAGALLVYL